MRKATKYRHLYQRVEYPRERGYRMEMYALPYYLYITIEVIGGSRYPIVHSRIHKNKEVRLGCYSLTFTDNDILRDISGEVFRRFIK